MKITILILLNLLKNILYFLFVFYSISGVAQIPVKTIVLDPGHGGKDNGTIGKHSVEKELTLKLAKELKSHIELNFPYINVVLTRDSDEFVRLIPRAEIANKNNADLFVSIHCNHHELEYVNGTEIYVLGLSKADENLEIVKRENNILGFNEEHDMEDAETHILLSMYQNSNIEKSLSIAGMLTEELSQGTDLKQRGVKQAGFSVLKRTSMPSILLETAYLSNFNDESYLLDPTKRSRIIQSMMKSIHTYLYPELSNSTSGEYFSILLFENDGNDADYFHKINDITYSSKTNIRGNQEYYTGHFYSFSKAKEAQQKLIGLGFEESKIILLGGNSESISSISSK